MNLVRAELLKISSTSTWWIIALVTVPMWAASLGFNYLFSSLKLSPEAMGDSAGDPTIAAMSQQSYIAADLYTTGQYLGVLMVMVLGALVMTNEFQHQTATTTFLTTPRRTPVVLAKLAAAVILGLLAWLVTTAANLVAGALLLKVLDLPMLLGETAIWQAIGMNALAYATWAVLGIGAAVLIRSQLGTTITVIGVYLAGSILTGTLWPILADKLGDWFNNLQVLVPTSASQLMIAGTDLPGNPERWVGAAVLVGYALVTGVVGTLIMKRRDIS